MKLEMFISILFFADKGKYESIDQYYHCWTLCQIEIKYFLLDNFQIANREMDGAQERKGQLKKKRKWTE